jgi:hypothetical protein
MSNRSFASLAFIPERKSSIRLSVAPAGLVFGSGNFHSVIVFARPLYS